MVQKSYAKFCTKFIYFSLDISNLYVRKRVNVYVVQPLNLHLFLVVSFGSRLLTQKVWRLLRLDLYTMYVKHFGDVL